MPRLCARPIRQMPIMLCTGFGKYMSIVDHCLSTVNLLVSMFRWPGEKTVGRVQKAEEETRRDQKKYYKKYTDLESAEFMQEDLLPCSCSCQFASRALRTDRSLFQIMSVWGYPTPVVIPSSSTRPCPWAPHNRYRGDGSRILVNLSIIIALLHITPWAAKSFEIPILPCYQRQHVPLLVSFVIGYFVFSAGASEKWGGGFLFGTNGTKNYRFLFQRKVCISVSQADWTD